MTPSRSLFSVSITFSIRSMAARACASRSSIDIVGGSRMREVAMSLLKETGDEGVVNSGEIGSRDVLITIVLGTGARPRYVP